MTMNQQARRVIRVTPTITGVTYGNNDILFDTMEIPLAVGKKGECSKLVSAMIISKSNSVFDGELFFCQTNQSVGAANSARNVSDADFAAAKVLEVRACHIYQSARGFVLPDSLVFAVVVSAAAVVSTPVGRIYT